VAHSAPTGRGWHAKARGRNGEAPARPAGVGAGAWARWSRAASPGAVAPGGAPGYGLMV